MKEKYIMDNNNMERKTDIQRDRLIQKLKQKVQELKDEDENKNNTIKDPLRNQKGIIKHFGLSNRLK